MLRSPDRLDRPAPARWKVWLRDGAFALLIVFGVGFFQTRSHLRGPAPTFSLQQLSGGTVDSASLKGKPVLLAFWAPWCGVCKTTSANVEWTRKLIGDHASVYSVAASYQGLADVQKYIGDRGAQYPVLLGNDDTVRDFKVDAYPTFYFLDENGQIKGSAVGYTTTLGLLARLWW